MSPEIVTQSSRSLCWDQLSLHLSLFQQTQATLLPQWQLPVVPPQHGRTKKCCQLKLQELRFF